MLAIRLPDGIDKRLEKLARRTGRTKSFYVRSAILQYLEDMEDLYMAHEVSERVRRGEEQTYPLEEVVKRLGLDAKDLEGRTHPNGRKTARKTR